MEVRPVGARKGLIALWSGLDVGVPGVGERRSVLPVRPVVEVELPGVREVLHFRCAPPLVEVGRPCIGKRRRVWGRQPAVQAWKAPASPCRVSKLSACNLRSRVQSDAFGCGRTQVRCSQIRSGAVGYGAMWSDAVWCGRERSVQSLARAWIWEGSVIQRAEAAECVGAAVEIVETWVVGGRGPGRFLGLVPLWGGRLGGGVLDRRAAGHGWLAWLLRAWELGVVALSGWGFIAGNP